MFGDKRPGILLNRLKKTYYYGTTDNHYTFGPALPPP